MSNKLNAWGMRWEVTKLINDGLGVVSGANLVRNIGFGPGASHTVNPFNSHRFAERAGSRDLGVSGSRQPHSCGLSTSASAKSPCFASLRSTLSATTGIRSQRRSLRLGGIGGYFSVQKLSGVHTTSTVLGLKLLASARIPPRINGRSCLVSSAMHGRFPSRIQKIKLDGLGLRDGYRQPLLACGFVSWSVRPRSPSCITGGFPRPPKPVATQTMHLGA